MILEDKEEDFSLELRKVLETPQQPPEINLKYVIGNLLHFCR